MKERPPPAGRGTGALDLHPGRYPRFVGGAGPPALNEPGPADHELAGRFRTISTAAKTIARKYRANTPRALAPYVNAHMDVTLRAKD